MKNWKNLRRCGWLMRKISYSQSLKWRSNENISTIFSSWIFLFLICHAILTPKCHCKRKNSSHVSFHPPASFCLLVGEESHIWNCDNMLIFLSSSFCIYVIYIFFLHVIFHFLAHIKRYDEIYPILVRILVKYISISN